MAHEVGFLPEREARLRRGACIPPPGATGGMSRSSLSRGHGTMKRLTEGRWTTVPLVAIIAVLIGGGAYALADGGSSGNGTITACVHKQGGGLYVARKCGKGDKKLSWNEVGPAGA